MQIEVKRGPVRGLHEGQRLTIKKGVPAMALMERKQKRPIGIVVVGDVELAEIEMRVSGAGGKKCRQLVICLGI